MLDSENKICQNCHSQFTIDAQDFKFYEKISVPPPTFCPECRLIRRLAWRNEHSLYNNICGLCQKAIISVFSKESELTVYCSSCWWSDKWDASVYAREYDFGRPFFPQLFDLFKKTPLPTLFGFRKENSEYCNMVNNLKNCYLVHNASHDENCYYSSTLVYVKDSLDCNLVSKSELCYEAVNCVTCYRVFFSQDCELSHNIWFSKNLIGCSDCFGCVNLCNKQYYIFNKPLKKEEYEQKIKEFRLYSLKNIQTYKTQTSAIWQKFPQKYMHGRHNDHVSGDYVYNSKNCFYCFDIAQMEDSKYCSILTSRSTKDCYDFTHYGENSELIYEGLQIGDGVSNAKFGWCNWTNIHNVDYCILIVNASNSFGSIGIRNTRYCVLNKQFTKDEYEKLVARIKEQMNTVPFIDKSGKVYTYGEFFPVELSPFGYNETTAQEYFSLTKDKAIMKGYKWKDREERNIKITIKTENIPDTIKDINDLIVNEVISCAHEGKCEEQCAEAFRIIPQELKFYRQMNLPLPRLCPNCRHYQIVKQRNPLKLWHRKCQCNQRPTTDDKRHYENTAPHFHGNKPCSNEFQTSYAPERPEIVYCEKCYLAEVA